jgi:hypothetical protein
MRKIFFVFALLASIDINATNHPPGYPDDVNFEIPIMLFSGSCHSGAGMFTTTQNVSEEECYESYVYPYYLANLDVPICTAKPGYMAVMMCILLTCIIWKKVKFGANSTHKFSLIKI